MGLKRKLRTWREPHTMSHIVIGHIPEVEQKLGRQYHKPTPLNTDIFCAICLTCDTCIDCTHDSTLTLAGARAHADDMALYELRKLGVRLLDGS